MSTRGIYGLSGSGIDVDSMVRVGMMSKQKQYDKMYKEQTKNQWRKDAYADLYADLTKFNNATMSNYKMSTTTSPMNTSSSKSTVATASANADAAVMTHTVNVTDLASNAYLLSHDHVKRANTSTSASKSLYLKDMLFDQTTQASLQAAMSAPGFDRNQALVKFEVADGQDETAHKRQLSFSYEDIFGSNETLNDLASRFNSAGVNIRASYDTANDTFSLYQKSGGDGNKILLSIAQDGSAESANGKRLIQNLDLAQSEQTTDASGNLTSTLSAPIAFAAHAGTHEIGGDETSYESGVSVAGTDALSSIFTPAGGMDHSASFVIKHGTKSATVSLADVTTDDYDSLVTAINAAAASVPGMDLQAARDPMTGRIKIGNTNPANTGNVSFDVSSSLQTNAAANGRSLLNAMKFVSDKKLTADTTGVDAAGKSATAVIDGKTYKSDTGKILVAGVSYTLQSKGSTSIAVSQDTDKLVENVKKFVEDYNKMIDKLNGMYTEKQYSDYQPLTKEQEAAMTKEQVAKWNEKAKSGLFYHDQNVGKIISSMREAIYTPVDSVEGKYNTMMSLGISSETNQGHLKLDEDKLKKAIAADPNAVRQVFSNLGEVKNADGTTSTNYKNEGAVNRISDALYANLKTMKKYAGNSSKIDDASQLGDLMKSLQTKMTNFQKLLDGFEKSLYKKYDAMEVAIQRLGVSMNYITGGR